MGKKASSKREIQTKPDDKVIKDLIEMRRLQQEALTKIIVAMDEPGSSTGSFKKKNYRRLPK